MSMTKNADTYSDYVLPVTEKTGRWSLSMAWWALFSAMFWLYLTTDSAGAVGVRNTLIGMVLSIITYITKPIDVPTLLRAMRKALAK